MLIARRVRELDVYCELLPFDAPAERIAGLDVRGIILSGGPDSVYDDDAPHRARSGSSSRAAGARHLLRHAADGPPARRQGRPGTRREYGLRRVEPTPASPPLFAGLPDELDVWMSHGDRLAATPGRVHRPRQIRQFALRRHGRRRRAGTTASSSTRRSCTRPRGKDILRNFVHGRLRLRRRLDGRQLHRRDRRGHPRPGRRRPRHLRPLGRRRLAPSLPRSCTAPSATSSPASSSTTACCAPAKPKKSSSTFKQTHAHQPRPRRGRRRVPRPARRRDGSGDQADPDRQHVRPHLREGGAQDRGRRIPRPGNALPRRDRERLATARAAREDQDPPQRRRPARGHEARASSSRCATSSRTRCAESARRWGCPRRWSGAIPSPARASRFASSAR